MMRFIALALALLVATPAWADLPDEVLAQDYKNCVGDGAADAARVAYCNCVRDGMRAWDTDVYVKNAMQALTSGDKALPSGQIGALAQKCLTQTLQ